MRVAIVGAGQLARMMALSGIPMGIEFAFLLSETESDRCVSNLGLVLRYQGGESGQHLFEALGKPDVVTIDHEHVPLKVLEALSAHCAVHPSVTALRQLSNRICQKNLLMQLNIATSNYFPFFCYEDLRDNAALLRLPLVLKASVGGYDGKSQFRIRNENDFEAFRDLIPNQLINGHAAYSQGFIAEEFVEFERELSFIAVRSVKGDIRFYAPAENRHEQAVLLSSIAPARNVSAVLQNEAHAMLVALMEALDYVGVLAMECFHVSNKNGERLLVNELAPRVHNSGHWTQAACYTSQFTNHLRAILGLNLGTTEAYTCAAMLNILGKEVDPIKLNANTSLHWYNKELRPNRKMGHINIVGKDYQSVLIEFDNLLKIL